MREPIGVGRVTGRRQRRPLIIEQRGERRVRGVPGEAAILCESREGGRWQPAWPGRVELNELGDVRVLMERFLSGEVR